MSQSFVVRRSEDDDDEMEPKQVPYLHAPYTTRHACKHECRPRWATSAYADGTCGHASVHAHTAVYMAL